LKNGALAFDFLLKRIGPGISIGSGEPISPHRQLPRIDMPPGGDQRLPASAIIVHPLRGRIRNRPPKLRDLRHVPSQRLCFFAIRCSFHDAPGVDMFLSAKGKLLSKATNQFLSAAISPEIRLPSQIKRPIQPAVRKGVFALFESDE